jgi:thymidylate synthase (FAD)
MKVELVDHMGSDLTVANAARRSFGKGFDVFHTREMGPRTPNGRSDEELIEDLARDGHLLPFRHPTIELSCDAPLPMARQLGKHQVGMTWSEISRRYKVGGIEFYRLDGTWRADVKDRRQGSGGLLPDHIQDRLNAIQHRNITHAIEDYEEALGLGAAPEQCRFLLPQSMEVFWTWTGSLLAYAHLWKLRHHKDTQLETQQFAEQVGDIMSKLYPVSWRALTSPGIRRLEEAEA